MIKHNKSRRIRNSLLAIGTAAAILSVSACAEAGSSDGTTTLRWASPNPETASQEVEIAAWMDIVTEESNGTIQFETYYNGSLFPASEALEAMRDGRTDMATMFQSYWPAEFPLWQSAGLPFALPADYDPFAEAESWWRTTQENEAVKAEFEKQEIHPAGFVGLSASVLAMSQPVNSIDDLRNRSIREPGLHGKAFNSIGAQAVALDPGEIYESLQRGVINGVSYPFATMSAMSFQEVSPHIVQHGLGAYGSYGIGINQQSWEALSDEERDAFTKATDRYFAERDQNILFETDMETCSTFIDEADGTATVLPKDEYEQWSDDYADKAYDEWVATAEDSGTARTEIEAMHENRLATYEELANDNYVPPIEVCADEN